MAIILKLNKTYRPHNPYGLDLEGSSYYGVVDCITYDKKDKYCFFDLRLFISQSGRLQGNECVEVIPFHYYGAGFDQHIGNDGLSIPQAYQKVLETMPEWQSDE